MQKVKAMLWWNVWHTQPNWHIYLSDKDPEELQCDVPGEEEETGTDPQVVEQGQVQQASNTVQRVGRAGGRRSNTDEWNVTTKQ